MCGDVNFWAGFLLSLSLYFLLCLLSRKCSPPWESMKTLLKALRSQALTALTKSNLKIRQPLLKTRPWLDHSTPPVPNFFSSNPTHSVPKIENDGVPGTWFFILTVIKHNIGWDIQLIKTNPINPSTENHYIMIYWEKWHGTGALVQWSSSCLWRVVGQFGTGQFGTENLAPGQIGTGKFGTRQFGTGKFGTGQFGTKVVKTDNLKSNVFLN